MLILLKKIAFFARKWKLETKNRVTSTFLTKLLKNESLL